MELCTGSQATGALAALERAMQAKRGQAGRGKGVGKAADAPPCLSVNVHVKGLITEVRLTNEGDEGGRSGADAALANNDEAAEHRAKKEVELAVQLAGRHRSVPSRRRAARAALRAALHVGAACQAHAQAAVALGQGRAYPSRRDGARHQVPRAACAAALVRLASQPL